MKEEWYKNMTERLRSHPKCVWLIHNFNWASTLMIATAYVGIVFLLFYFGYPTFSKAVMVPLSGFLTLTAVRSLVNRQRPYEQFDLEPVIPKKTKGKSFPSRHIYSAFIIAFTYLYVGDIKITGIFFLILAILMAVVRVISAVHFLSDVLAGIVWAAVFAFVGYCL